MEKNSIINKPNLISWNITHVCNTMYVVTFNTNVEKEYFCYLFVTRIFFIYLFSKSKCEKQFLWIGINQRKILEIFIFSMVNKQNLGLFYHIYFP